MKKLNIHDTAGLTRYALRKGMVPEKASLQESANKVTAERRRELLGES